MENNIHDVVSDIVKKLFKKSGEVELTLKQLEEITSPIYQFDYNKLQQEIIISEENLEFKEICPETFYKFLLLNNLVESFIDVFLSERPLFKRNKYTYLKEYFQESKQSSYIDHLCTWVDYDEIDLSEIHKTWVSLLIKITKMSIITDKDYMIYPYEPF